MTGLSRGPCLVVPLVVLLWAAPSRGEPVEGEVVVDRVVAVIDTGGQDSVIVTLFELEFEARLARAMSRGNVEAGRQAPSASALQAVLARVVSEHLLVTEANRLRSVTMADAEIDAQRAALESRLGGPGTLDQFVAMCRAPADMMAAIIERRTVAGLFVEDIPVRVSDQEVSAYFRAGEHAYVGQELDDVRETLEAILLSERRAEELERILDQIRRQTRLRIIPE